MLSCCAGRSYHECCCCRCHGAAACSLIVNIPFFIVLTILHHAIHAGRAVGPAFLLFIFLCSVLIFICVLIICVPLCSIVLIFWAEGRSRGSCLDGSFPSLLRLGFWLALDCTFLLSLLHLACNLVALAYCSLLCFAVEQLSKPLLSFFYVIILTQ